MLRVNQKDQKGLVQTVTGLISPEFLGPTLLHEHILCDIRPPAWKQMEQIGETINLENRFAIDYGEVIAPGNCVLDKVEIAIRELKSLYADGGRTIVDLSCGGLHPMPIELQKIAQETGLNIILGCGYYVDEYQSETVRAKSCEILCQEMIDQIQLGAWNTNIRAGIIGEIGCQDPWTEFEKLVMRAAIMAQSQTGASLAIHPGRHQDQPQEIADFLLQHNAQMDRAIISHIDRTIFDDERLFRLADTGVIIEFDLFGMETSFYKLNLDVDMPNDALRLKAIRKLINRGHLSQIAISHDICFKSRLSCNGGHGYGHIFRNVLPLMLRRSFSQKEIDTIIIETPKRLLTIV